MMDSRDLAEWGSQTAKGGFKNEDDIVKKFNNWDNDEDGQKWLIIMGYDLKEIEYVKAVKIAREKTDVQVQVTIKLKKAIDVENLQVKLVSNPRGFNQIDKRWVNQYATLWNIPPRVVTLLKHYTGELPPSITRPRDPRRMFVDEFSQQDREALLNFFQANKHLIVNDILKGRGRFAAEWMLVVQKINRNATWVLKPMNLAINHFGGGDIVITDNGNIKIGKITVQRKGGDAGRETSKMLQFKINPAELFDV